MAEKAPKFVPHVNRSLLDKSGKPMKFNTAEDYTRELNKRGLEPYTGTITPPKSGSYKEAKIDRALIRRAAELQKSGKTPNSTFIDALNKLGTYKSPSWAKNSQGGFHNGD